MRSCLVVAIAVSFTKKGSQRICKHEAAHVRRPPFFDPNHCIYRSAQGPGPESAPKSAFLSDFGHLGDFARSAPKSALRSAFWRFFCFRGPRPRMRKGTSPQSTLWGHSETLRYPGNSQRESGRFARIDSQKKKRIFITFKRIARIASNLRFAMFSAPKSDSQKGVQFWNPEMNHGN